jgi:hypothetical protein
VGGIVASHRVKPVACFRAELSAQLLCGSRGSQQSREQTNKCALSLLSDTQIYCLWHILLHIRICNTSNHAVHTQIMDVTYFPPATLPMLWWWLCSCATGAVTRVMTARSPHCAPETDVRVCVRERRAKCQLQHHIQEQKTDKRAAVIAEFMPRRAVVLLFLADRGQPWPLWQSVQPASPARTTIQKLTEFKIVPSSEFDTWCHRAFCSAD